MVAKKIGREKKNQKSPSIEIRKICNKNRLYNTHTMSKKMFVLRVKVTRDKKSTPRLDRMGLTRPSCHRLLRQIKKSYY